MLVKWHSWNIRHILKIDNFFHKCLGSFPTVLCSIKFISSFLRTVNFRFNIVYELVKHLFALLFNILLILMDFLLCFIKYWEVCCIHDVSTCTYPVDWAILAGISTTWQNYVHWSIFMNIIRVANLILLLLIPGLFSICNWFHIPIRIIRWFYQQFRFRLTYINTTLPCMRLPGIPSIRQLFGGFP